MKKIIITGFEPFGEYEFNPTMDLVKHYDGETLRNIKIIGLVLPATYDAFKKLQMVMEKEEPVDAIINTGFSSTVKGIQIETVFRNKMESKYPDANGHKPEGLPISTGTHARNFLGSDSDPLLLANRLFDAGIPVEISSNADTFICNALAYQTVRSIWQGDWIIPNVFIHIPWTSDYKDRITLPPDKIFMDTRKVHEAIEIIIENLMEIFLGED